MGESITARECLLVAWAILMVCIGYSAGTLQQFLMHYEAHHVSGGVGVCESAPYCAAYAPRELCLVWKDEDA